MSLINRIEVTEFSFPVPGIGISGSGQSMVCKPNSTITVKRFALRLRTDDDCEGSYVTHWGGLPGALAQVRMLAPFLLGRDPEHREKIFDDLKREARQLDHMGHGPLDIALWDWAGKKYRAPIHRLLGTYRTSFPAYASSYHGDDNGVLDCTEAYVAFAEQCHALGYQYFKIHGWNDGDARREAKNVRGVAAKMGDRMGLMLDPACELRTFADALHVGRACDDGGYLWYEDPFRDGGYSAFAHRKLRESIRTPLLLTEHIRGIEQKADFLLAGGTDFLRADPEYDMGITGVMKIARFAEACGMDVEIHGPGPAHRHCMAAMRNSNYYEIALVGPNTPNVIPPVYRCGYTDQLDCVDSKGFVSVPDGPGLGVDYDWEFIYRNQTAQFVVA